MVEVMKIMVISFKRSHACAAALSVPDPTAGHRRPTSPLETPGHSQASLGQSLFWVTAPFSWVLCVQGFVCALQEFVSPVLWKFYNLIPLASKVKLPGGSQFLFQIPGLENLLSILELS